MVRPHHLLLHEISPVVLAPAFFCKIIPQSIIKQNQIVWLLLLLKDVHMSSAKSFSKKDIAVVLDIGLRIQLQWIDNKASVPIGDCQSIAV